MGWTDVTPNSELQGIPEAQKILVQDVPTLSRHHLPKEGYPGYSSS